MNTIKGSTNKKLILLGHAFFIILFLSALYFYQERVLFIDTVFHFFKITNFDKVNIEAGRYTPILTQIPLLLGIKFNLSLKSLMLIYSLSFILLYYLIYLLIVYVFKNPFIGLALPIILVINISQSFFHSSTETHQALAYCTLFFAILFWQPKKNFIHYILLFITIILSFFSHPISTFPIIFGCLYYIIEQKDYKNPKSYILILFIILLSILKIVYTKTDSYEGNFFETFLTFSFSKLFHSYSLLFFYRKIISLYLLSLVVFVLTVIMINKKKEKLKLVYLLVSFFGFLLISGVTFYKGDAQVMFERAFMPIAFFSVIPFFYELSKGYQLFSKQSILFLFISMIFLFGYLKIHVEGLKFKERKQIVYNLIQEIHQNNKNKILLKDDGNLGNQFSKWSFPFTTLVYSSILYPENSITVFFCKETDKEKYDMYTKDPEYNNIFLGAEFWLLWNTDDFNKKYYNLPHGLYSFIDNYKIDNNGKFHFY
jgi:hypothetical protein